MHTRCLIVGSGPAGYTAAIYAVRAGLNPILFQGLQPGGQLMITADVENYPGFADVVQGPWLMEQMQAQAKNIGAQIMFDHVMQVDLSQKPFLCRAESQQNYTCDTLIIATGAQAKWLGLANEQKYMGHGVSGCATCDAFFFKDKTVCVVGGGDTAVEEALYLTNHAKKVYLIHRRDTLRAAEVAQQHLFKHPKIEVLWHHIVFDIVGNETNVTNVVLENTHSGQQSGLSVDGVFVAIGHKPSTDLFVDQLDRDSDGYIITQPGSTHTSVKGVFAAGDVQDKVYRQAVTATGQGCMAALDAYRYLQNPS